MIVQPGAGLMGYGYTPDDYFYIPKRLDSKLKIFFNGSQIEALSSIKIRGITLIQGPPGTGKTTAILGLAQFEARRKEHG
jgi:flagellar biosynthesis GTPase FlhF